MRFYIVICDCLLVCLTAISIHELQMSQYSRIKNELFLFVFIRQNGFPFFWDLHTASYVCRRNAQAICLYYLGQLRGLSLGVPYFQSTWPYSPAENWINWPTLTWTAGGRHCEVVIGMHVSYAFNLYIHWALQPFCWSTERRKLNHEIRRAGRSRVCRTEILSGNWHSELWPASNGSKITRPQQIPR